MKNKTQHENNGLLLKKIFTKNTITVLAVLVAYAVVAVMVYGGSAPRQLLNMLISLSCYIVLAVSLNLVVGMLGELSLGHAGFMSVGLFSGCLFSMATTALPLPLFIRLPLAMVVGGCAAALIGFVVGLPALRLKGDYLAIVTLACGEIIRNIITNLKITGGATGLTTNLPPRNIYSNTKTLLPYAVVLIVLTIIVVMNLKRSRHGRAIMAIRDNRIAAEAMGINVTYFKLMVFIVAAFLAGMAGVLYGHSLANIKAATFDYNMSIEILVIVVLGGMGSIHGSIIATVVLRVLPELLREFSDYRMLLYSVLLIVIMLLNASPRFAEFKGRWSIPSIIKALRAKKSAAGSPADSESEHRADNENDMSGSAEKESDNDK